MNIPEILSGIEDLADRQNFICALTDAEAAITDALDSVPEKLEDAFDELFQIQQALSKLNCAIDQWE